MVLFKPSFLQSIHKSITRQKPDTKSGFLVMLSKNKRKQYDRFNSVNLGKHFALRKAKKHKQLVPLSKRTAKKDKQSAHKAKAWLCHKPKVSRITRACQVSKIDWI